VAKATQARGDHPPISPERGSRREGMTLRPGGITRGPPHALSGAGAGDERISSDLWGLTRRRGTEEGREMALDRLGHLEARIQESHDLHPQQKAELLQLLAELKEAMAEGSITETAPPQGPTSVPDQSAPEGTREDTPQHPVRMAMDELSTAIEAFEASHPELVTTVNQISTLLANMGI
jgi:Domain of unknown function (DUF4404)